MRLLVSVLVRDLGLSTYASCGGHTKLYGRLNPAMRREFYVSFCIPQDAAENFERSLSIIKAATKEYDGKIILENDAETHSDIFADNSGWCSWTITGKGIRPDDFAIMILSKNRRFISKK